MDRTSRLAARPQLPAPLNETAPLYRSARARCYALSVDRDQCRRRQACALAARRENRQGAAALSLRGDRQGRRPQAERGGERAAVNTPHTHVWCDACQAIRPAQIADMHADDVSGQYTEASDLRCGHCGFVIATLYL